MYSRLVYVGRCARTDVRKPMSKRKHVAPHALPSVLGHTCKICNAIGEHLEDACPAKTLVHMPRTFRKEVHDQTVAAVRETFYTPPNFLPGGELVPLLRARADVPPELRCVACTLLAQDAVWCGCCDVVACAACLGPATEPYMCCVCHGTSPDDFHVVRALRGLATAWQRAMALCADKATFLRGVAETPPVDAAPTSKNLGRQYNPTKSRT